MRNPLAGPDDQHPGSSRTRRMERDVHPAGDADRPLALHFPEGPLRLAPLFSVAALAALAACGSTPPRQYGQYSALQPRFTVLGKEGTRPESLAVALTQPAYVAVLYVVPGVGSTLIYPTDSTTYNHLNGGTTKVAVTFPHAPPLDSIRRRMAEMQRESRRDRGSVRQGGRAARDSAATRRDTMPRFLPDTSLAAATGGYLLMIASPTPLSYTAIRRHVQGISIPLDDDEALNTVVKMVRATLPEGTAWAAQSKEIDVGDSGYTQPVRRTTGR